MGALETLTSARKAVPALDYALGAVGLAAAGSLVIGFLGNIRAAAIVFGVMLIVMVLLFVFARLVAAENAATTRAGITLMWMVIAFFGVFLLFTVTAYAFKVPAPWAEVLGIHVASDPSRLAKEAIAIPKDIENRFSKEQLRTDVHLVRLQERSQSPQGLRREAEIGREGSYYSFVRQTHEHGRGYDIEFGDGLFKVGFAGADYGFFMRVGPANIKELAALTQDNPPIGIAKEATDAWKYMWDYRPPSDIKGIRQEQSKLRGIAVGNTKLSQQVSINDGTLYLLRSISIEASDVLVAFAVTDRLADGSAILAWRVLKNYDIPISTGQEN